MSKTKDVPDNFEVFLNVDKLPTLLNEEKGIVIDVAHLEHRNPRDPEGLDFRVIGSRNQKAFYSGAFPDRESAEDKAYQLAKDRC